MYVGKQDTFERIYRGKFLEFASRFGEIVNYERDRGARDVGIHLTKKRSSGGEIMSSSICWFQLKGITQPTLSKEQFENASQVDIRLEVKDLRFWYLLAGPTYLVVYVESVDKFLYMNIQNHVASTWGNDIFRLDQKTIKVSIPKSDAHFLDETAFYQLLVDNEVKQWVNIFGADEHKANLCIRDYALISRVATAKKRNVKQRLYIWYWLTKTRTEIYFEEQPKGSKDWQRMHSHWQVFLLMEEIESNFPYLHLSPNKEHEDQYYDWFEDDLPTVDLANGTATGVEYSGEAVVYVLSLKLNELGRQMYEWIQLMESAGVIEIDYDKPSTIHVVPWAYRAT